MRRKLLYGAELAAIAAISAGASLIYFPAGLIVFGLAVVALIEANT